MTRGDWLCRLTRWLAGCLLACLMAVPSHAVTYVTQQKFIDAAFESKASQRILWLTRDERSMTASILGHAYRGLRIRYWQAASRSAWILDEIGKEKPITVGIVIDAGQVDTVRILAYRESRGAEVRYPSFTSQFLGARLKGRKLTNDIDGISGATLSVRAVTNIARWALFLDSLLTEESKGQQDTKAGRAEIKSTGARLNVG